jgi:hypothetical protein
MTHSTKAFTAIDEHLSFMNTNEETYKVLRQLKPLLDSSLFPAFDVFYDEALSTPQTRASFVLTPTGRGSAAAIVETAKTRSTAKGSP